MPSVRSRRGTQSTLRAYGVPIAICFAAVWVVSLAWWLLLPEARIVPLEIPNGTAAAIIRGEAVAAIPDALSLRKGDTLAVQNDDTVTHQIGTVWLPPGRATQILVSADLLAGQSLLCSIHPSGAIGVSLLARPNILATIIPTLLAGVPASIALLVALMLIRGLEEHESNAAVV